MMKEFMINFIQQLKMLKLMPKERGERILGTDPGTGKPVSVRLGNLVPWLK
jgi:topoisomerase IA-like protein